MTKILVIDDEEYIRKLYTEFLSREGYAVEAAGSYHEAQKLMSVRKYDLVILDIELGDANGLDVLKKIKNEYPNLSVILNTSYSVYKDDFHTWLADGYVVKSSDLEALKNKIEQLVEA
jgi:two-component system, OmpR family, response regulator